MITREEYELLKEYREQGYKRIARDKNCDLYAFKTLPMKFKFFWSIKRGSPYPRLVCEREENILTCVTWEDEKPTKIDDLIRDYESHQVIKQGENNVNKKKLMKKYKDYLIMAAVFVSFILITALVYFLIWIIFGEYIITLWDSLIYFLNK